MATRAWARAGAARADGRPSRARIRRVDGGVGAPASAACDLAIAVRAEVAIASAPA